MSEPDQPSKTPVRGDAPPESPWERDVLIRLAEGALREQRISRRWNLLFRFALLTYLVVVLVLSLPAFGDGSVSSPHTALVRVQGTIAAEGEASAGRINAALREAFDNDAAQGVVLYVDSPGGSAVQAGLVFDEVRRLRTDHPDKRVYAVLGDLCASGGYYIAAAADEIYADKASLVGSIGVIFSSFGFAEAMQRIGVERRVLTAGENKALLDPFLPPNEAQQAHMRQVLEVVHEQFISVVKSGRGDRLKDDDALFSGLIWTGEQALELGMVDALGSARYVAREIIGAEEIVDYSVAPDLLGRVAQRFGMALESALGRVLQGGLELR